MNSITQYAIDFIYAKISGGKVWFGNLARYKTRYEVTDFADDDLVTRYFVESIVSPSPIFNGDVVNIPSGSTLAGDGYFEIDYTPYIAGHGQNPGIFVLINKSSVENQLIYDIPVSSINDGSDLIAFRVYCHQDPSDPTKSIDNIVLLIK